MVRVTRLVHIVSVLVLLLSTTASRWTEWQFVPADITRHTLENIVIDNYLFGVAAVDRLGHESPVAFPGGLIED